MDNGALAPSAKGKDRRGKAAGRAMGKAARVQLIAGILISSILVGASCAAALFTMRPSRSPASLLQVETAVADQLLLRGVHARAQSASPDAAHSQDSAFVITPVRRYFLAEKKGLEDAPFNYYAVLYRQTDYAPEGRELQSVYYMAAATNLRVKDQRIAALDQAARILPFDPESAAGNWLAGMGARYRMEELPPSSVGYRAYAYSEVCSDGAGSAYLLEMDQGELIPPPSPGAGRANTYASALGYTLTVPDAWLGNAVFEEDGGNLSVFARSVYEKHLLEGSPHDGLLFTLEAVDTRELDAGLADVPASSRRMGESNGRTVVWKDAGTRDGQAEGIYAEMSGQVGDVLGTLSFSQLMGEGEPISGTVGAADEAIGVQGVCYPEEMGSAFEQVNRERASNGMDPLAWDPGLEQAALQRALEISVRWSHTRPDGTKWYTVSGDAQGENISMGHAGSAAVVRGWMDSPWHRANILRGGFTRTAAACVDMGGGPRWVQLFGV